MQFMNIKRLYNNPWFESITDTAVGTLINFPLNILLLWSADRMNFTILQTSIYLSVVFIIIAILRKTYIRTFFNKHSCHAGDKTL